MRAVYHGDNALTAEATLEGLARQLERTTPEPPGSFVRDSPRRSRSSVSGSRRRSEDAALDERHRVDDRDLPGSLEQREALADGKMALRWCAAGMIEARKQFRKVNGSMHLPALRAALERHVNGSVTEPNYDQKDVVAA